MTENVTLRRDGDIAWVRFTGADRMNAISLSMLERFHEIVDELEAGIPRVVVIEGGEKHFSSGADLDAMCSISEREYRNFIDAEYRLFRRIDLLPTITIASIRGACIGNAAELTLACDFRIGTHSLRWGLPEVRVGFPAPAQRIARFVGIAAAKELIYLSAVIDAQRCLDLGLVSRLVDEDTLSQATREFAKQCGALAPLAIRCSKAALSRAYEVGRSHDYEELEASSEMFRSQDFREGVSSILEKREPVFSGR